MGKVLKKDLWAALKKLGVEFDEAETIPVIEKKLKKAEKAAAKVAKEAGEGEDRLEPPSDEGKEGDDVPPKLEAPDQVLPPAAEEGDYLRKFQYRKQTVPGSVDSDPQAGSKAAIMKEQLLKQERVRIFVPRASGESTAIKLSININGYRLDLPKQAYLELPLQVAELVMDSLSQTEDAILRDQITGDKKKEYALL